MLNFNSSVHHVNNGCLMMRRYVITNFSYAEMHPWHAHIHIKPSLMHLLHVSRPFNKTLQLDTYLQLTNDILSRRCLLAVSTGEEHHVPDALCFTHDEGNVDVNFEGCAEQQSVCTAEI